MATNGEAEPPDHGGDTAALAINATDAFYSAQYDQCINFLNHLSQNDDCHFFKVHNIAIARYFQGGCSDLKRLLDELNEVKNRNKKIVCGDKSTDFDHPLTMLNIAFIWFLLHEHANAYSILRSLFKKIESFDEITSLRVCLLFLDVALASHDPKILADVIKYVEKTYFYRTSIDKLNVIGTIQQESTDLTMKSSSLSNKLASIDISDITALGDFGASDLSLSRTSSDEIETLLSTKDVNGQKTAEPSEVQSSKIFLGDQTNCHIISFSALRRRLYLYKVQLLILTSDLKAARSEVEMTTTKFIASGHASLFSLLLKSQLEYSCCNYYKAIKLLMFFFSYSRSDPFLLSVFNNNLGCIFYRLGKYHTSSMFFIKALTYRSSLLKKNFSKLSALSSDGSHQIVYNCGVQYLARGKPIEAARCFQKASLVFYNRPLLWLRIAECCIMALGQGDLESSNSEVKVHVNGNGKWRHFVIEDWFASDGQLNFIENNYTGSKKEKQPRLSFSLAQKCLRNALYLLNCPKDDENKDENGVEREEKDKDENELDVTIQSSILSYNDVCERENHKLKQALLADLAYIELQLGNPPKALIAAMALLGLPDCSRIYIFLGNVYAAESLCLQNRLEEAAEHLLIYLTNGNTYEFPYSEEDCEQWQGEKIVNFEESTDNNPSLGEAQEHFFLKPEQARGTAYANLALLYAVQGNLELAHEVAVQALSSASNSLQVIFTDIYIDLMIGKTHEALSKLKQCNYFRFLPNSFSDIK